MIVVTVTHVIQTEEPVSNKRLVRYLYMIPCKWIRFVAHVNPVFAKVNVIWNYNKKQDCLSRVVMVTDKKQQILNCNILFYFK